MKIEIKVDLDLYSYLIQDMRLRQIQDFKLKYQYKEWIEECTQ